MKIAYLSPSFPPISGGMGTACYYTAKQIGQDHQVSVFLASQKNITYTSDDNFSIKIFHPWFRYGYAHFSPQLIWRLKNFDIVHLYYPYYGVAEFLPLLKLFAKRPKIIIHHAMEAVGEGWIKKVFSHHRKIFMPRVMKTADLIFALSEDYAAYSDLAPFYQKYQAKIKIIPHGVELEKFKLKDFAKQSELKKQLGLPDKKIIFTAQALDRQHYFKGIDILIKAARRLPDTAQIVIAGDGDLRQTYENLSTKLNLQKKIIFLGTITQNQLPKFYQAADLVVVPSVAATECFSLVAVEALASGTPVIVSDWPGLRVTIDNDSGLIVKPGDIDDLSEKINFLLADDKLRQKFGLAARKRVAQFFDWTKICQNINQAYKNLLPAVNKQKICLITSIFSPYTRGGAETVVKNIVAEFKNKNYEIIIITICPYQKISSLWPKKTSENGLTIYRFYPLNIFSYLNINHYQNHAFWRLLWHGFDMFNLHSYFIIKKILRSERPPVVMTHVLKGIGYLTCRAIKSLGIKNIHTLHDVQLYTPSGLILKGLENSWQHTFFLTRLFRWINRLLLNNPDVVISSSKFLIDFYASKKFFPRSQKIILTNPINIKTTAKTHEISLKQDFTFLFVGQIEKYKGVLLLINVFQKLSATLMANEKINLIVVGTGNALNEAKQLANHNQNIIFKGYLPNLELKIIFESTNVTVVPSLCYENSPTVIFESLSYGVPVLAARIGGIEFIKDNYNGFTFEAGDEADLLKIMKFCLTNKKQLAEMSTNCQASINNIGVENYVKKLEELI